MKLNRTQNAAVLIAVVFLLVGKYGEEVSGIRNLVPAAVIGILLLLPLLNYDHCLEFGRRVVQFLYQRWQWRQHLKMMRYQSQSQRRP